MLTNNSLANSWLKNAVYALAIAGIYSIVLVVLRTPQISNLISDKDLFKSSLIVHVNLSVLIWLMSIIALFWSYGVKEFNLASSFSKLAFAGTTLIATSPFIGESVPFMNNYVPMLDNLSFIVGLTLFGVAVLFFAVSTCLLSLFDLKSKSNTIQLLGVFKLTSSIMFIAVWGCMIWSYFTLRQVSASVELDQDFFYELLYWSGGHYLQFIYTQGMIFALIVLLEAALMHKSFMIGVYKILFWVNFCFVLVSFYGHINYEIIDGSFKEFYTLHMIYLGGVVPVLSIMVLSYDFYLMRKSRLSLLLELKRISDDSSDLKLGRKISRPDNSNTKSESDSSRDLTNDISRLIYMNNTILIVILSSLTLFGLGGFVGAYISGINVTIPAHYHGSIIGVSISFIGIAYLFCYQAEVRANLTKVISELYGSSYSSNDNFLNVFIGTNSLKGLIFTGYKKFNPEEPILDEMDPSRIKTIFNRIKDFARESKLARMQIIFFSFGQIVHIVGLALAGGYGVMRKSPGIEIPLSAKIYMGMVGGGGLIAVACGLIFVYICVKKLQSI